MKKLRVIVCGSTFGQYYIRALQTVPDEFEVVGLLANGSNRSKLCADFYHVPLYTQIEDIPEVDIACVVIRSRAIGGSGTDIAEYFLNKKVHVIQEQPIHPKDMEVCYRAAKKNHVLFQMGDLYPNLIEVKNFIKCARYLNKKENPLYLRASFSPQVSYPAIDIISRIVPSIHTWKIKSITKELGPFDILMGEIGKTPIFIEYHNQVDPRDPDNYMHLLHSFTLFYSTGKLVLWCGVLKESDGVEESVLSIPSNNNPTSLLGAGLFIKQFKRTDVFLDKMEINRRLEKYLPAYMLPSEICIIDRIPLSANGKIDRKAVEDWFERYRISEDKIAEKEETKTDLEKMICQIWCEALDIGDLGRKENFYDYGADSLIMAQVTTKVRSKLEKEIPFDALLRQMLNTPTIEEIALYISAYDNQEIESPMCEKKFEYIAKNGERNGNRGRILLHGALGSVDVYRYLIPEMEKQNCGEIISIGISDLDEYCKLESEEVVLHLADLYTQKILEENLDKVQIVGYSFSGVIAIEMAKQLLEAGIDVEDVAIIDGGSIPVEIQDEIIYELFFIGNLHVSLEKLEFTDLKVFEKIFGKIVDSKQDSISISDFEDSQEDCHIYERLLELSQLTQEVRFKTYLSVSDDSSVRNFNFDMVKHLYTIFKKSFAALRFVPTVYFGDIRYFKTTERNGIFKYFEALLQEWDDVCIGDFEIIEIAGNHYSCLENPNYAHELAKKLGSVYEEWREE